MKSTSLTIILSSIFLFSCGGSEEASVTGIPKKDYKASLTYTSWEKECTPFYDSSDEDASITLHTKVKLRIDSSLKVTKTNEYFRPTDTLCDSLLYTTTDIARFDIKSRVVTEESIEAYGLNETFIYSSEGHELFTRYTLIYVDTEKLYFGQSSGENRGETAETRHSSISIDDYFVQITN